MSYRDLFFKPQYKYFVIVLLGFMQCQQVRTLFWLQCSVGRSDVGEPMAMQPSQSRTSNKLFGHALEGADFFVLLDRG